MSRYSEAEREQFQKMRVCILSPMVVPEPDWVQSVVNMTAYSWANGLRIFEMGKLVKQVVHWARNELVRMALEAQSPDGPYTHFLWLDADHVFKPYLACQLARHFATTPEADAVSALYYCRTGKVLPVAYVRDFSGDIFKHFPILEVPETLCEVDAFGFGGVLIRREVFEKVESPWFRFDGCGEDIYFCAHAKESGFRLFLDGQMKMGHIGNAPIITEDTYRAYLSEHSAELGDRIRVGLGGVKDAV